MGVLDHHDGGVHHGPDGDGDAAQRHDVGVQVDVVHRDQRHQDGDGQSEDRHQGAAEVKEENKTDQTDDDELFQQFLLQGVDGPKNELGAVIDRYDFDPFRQRTFDLLNLFLDPLDDRQGVLPEADDDDAAHHFSLTVEFGHAPADIRPQVDIGDVAQVDGRPPLVHAHRNQLDVGEVFDVAQAAHHVLPPAELHHPPSHVVVAAADGLDHFIDGQVVSQQRVGVEVHLVLLDEASHAGHFRYPRDRGQPVAHVPVLEGAQLGQIMTPRPVHKRILKGPTHAGGVRSQDRGYPLGETSGHPLHVLEHARARPIDVGAVLKDDVDEREAEEGVTPDDLHLGCGEKSRDDGIGDLVFDQVGAAAFPLRKDDHLDIGEVRDGVEGGVVGGPGAPGNGEESTQEDVELVFGAPLDEFFYHVTLAFQAAARRRPPASTHSGA